MTNEKFQMVNGKYQCLLQFNKNKGLVYCGILSIHLVNLHKTLTHRITPHSCASFDFLFDILRLTGTPKENFRKLYNFLHL